MKPQSVRYEQNESIADDIAAHLRECDVEFMPPLSTTVDIEAYALKIAANAERFEAWAGDSLAGLVAAYCNAHDRDSAFVTNVSVLPSAQGQGIAAQLIKACIDHARTAGFSQLLLEVNAANEAAAALYRRSGFLVSGERGPTQMLRLSL
ncbi:GNAT family N-acetyltransferase [Maricaulaceae bacterium MS644]